MNRLELLFKIQPFIALVIFLLPLKALSSDPFVQFRIGMMNAGHANSAMTIGGKAGLDFDRKIRVGFSTDIYRAVYTKTSARVAGFMDRDIENTSVILPLIFSFDIVLFKGNSPFEFYTGVGVGYQFLFNKEENYIEGISESRTYSGTGFQIEAGLEYKISDRQRLAFEAYYNGCTTNRTGKNNFGLPIAKEFDISGFGFRGGMTFHI